VSHLKERIEKKCLNCNAVLDGRFCSICGQENIAPQETVWLLLTHFLYDIVHFDGKFFVTLKYLLTKPGFLTLEHLKGRRADYLHPIRLYIFVSATFFFIFFSFIVPHDKLEHSILETAKNEKLKELDKLKKETLLNLEKTNNNKFLLQKLDSIHKAIIETKTKNTSNLINNSVEINLGSSEDEIFEYKNMKHYDSINVSKKHSIISKFKRNFYNKIFLIRDQFENNSNEMFSKIIEKFFHLFPQMLFLSLPLASLILLCFYVRNKQFYFVNHLIFLIHIYTFLFMCFLIIFGLISLLQAINFKPQKFISVVATLFIFGYQYKAFKNFYGQSRTKTIFKYCMFNTISTILSLVLLTIFLLFTAFTI
jgi:Protein of unknown function (DUF3667)